MKLSKNQKIVIIGFIITIGIAFWEGRPISTISFGNIITFPKELQSDGSDYYVDLITANFGKSPGKFTATIFSNGANVSLDKKNWGKMETQDFIVIPDSKSYHHRIYVKLNETANSFSISFNTQQDPYPPIQEITPTDLVNVTYQMSGGKWQWIG